MKHFATTMICGVLLFAWAGVIGAAESWKRHAIDTSSRGADGVRLADVDHDGRLDIVTGWEQGGVIRLYLHPGKDRSKVTAPWPAVTVGKVKSPEDAVLADLDGDGFLDVVSCCEGKTRSIYVHWSPSDKSVILDEQAWRTEAFPATAAKQQWMYALPMQVDGRHGIDLIVGSKGKSATVGWLRGPADPRKVEAWKFQPLYRAGWIMSLEAEDLDGDGDLDVVISDRKGPTRGVLWLENPGTEAASRNAAWPQHRIGGDGMEVMFLTIADLDGDGRRDIVCTTRNDKLLFFRRLAGKAVAYQTLEIKNPFGIRHGKAVAVGDIDLDGKMDLVHTTNKGNKSIRMPAVSWMQAGAADWSRWKAFNISGPSGVKFDLVELLDLDGDGDLDVLTCEEAVNLGVFWYENPAR